MITEHEQRPRDTCFNSSHPLFQHLSKEELEEVSTNKITESFQRGSIIYQEGFHMKGFFCVLQGIIKIFKTGSDGKEQIIRFAKTGEIIGYRSVLSHEAACTSSQVIHDALLCHIPGQILFKLVKNNGNFALELCKLICKELGEANSYLTDIAQKTVKERLAEILVQLEDEFGTTGEGVLNITLTREELSNIVGTATESIIRLLSDLKNANYIELRGRKIKILDKPGLKFIAGI